ncbi:MAG: zinc ribbon domain-containing protein [Bryobacteraceae bacterium]|jgi:site-specific DNA recombinase
MITEATWKKAQKTLQDNLLFDKRSARNQYLLRGLIKCGLCGLTYVGVAANRFNGKREFYSTQALRLQSSIAPAALISSVPPA